MLNLDVDVSDNLSNESEYLNRKYFPTNNSQLFEFPPIIIHNYVPQLFEDCLKRCL